MTVQSGGGVYMADLNPDERRAVVESVDLVWAANPAKPRVLAPSSGLGVNDLRCGEMIHDVGHDFWAFVSQVWDASRGMVLESHFGNIIRVRRGEDGTLRRVEFAVGDY